jgi:DNA-directed RNA polymerase specialized sigma24 family protein
MKSSPEFDEAYAPLFSEAVQVAERITGDRSLAEDVAVETLARARLAWWRVGDRADAWVVGKATGRALRAARRDPTLAKARPVAELRRLSRRQRQVVALCDVVRLDPVDAAEVLGSSRRVVERRRRRGRRRLGWR